MRNISLCHLIKQQEVASKIPSVMGEKSSNFDMNVLYWVGLTLGKEKWMYQRLLYTAVGPGKGLGRWRVARAGLDVEARLNGHLMMVHGIAKVRSRLLDLVLIVSSVVQWFGIRDCRVECTMYSLPRFCKHIEIIYTINKYKQIRTWTVRDCEETLG